MKAVLETYGSTNEVIGDSRILHFWTMEHGVDGVVVGPVKSNNREALEFLYRMVQSKVWDECNATST